MGKSNRPNPQPDQSSSEPTEPAPKTNDASDLDRRLLALEKSSAELNKGYLDILKWTIAAVFPAFALLLTILSLVARYDASQSIKEAQVKVEKATSEMENKFKELAGEALKKPLLELLHDGKPLENQIVDLISPGTAEVWLNSLFLKNVGERNTDRLSVRLFLSTPRKLPYLNGYWETVESFEKSYDNCLSLNKAITVASKETLNLHLSLSWVGTGMDRRFCQSGPGKRRESLN